MSLNLTILASFLSAFFITFFLTPLSIRILKKFKVLDDPKRKHPGVIHKKPVPRGGGIPLFLGVFGASLIFLPRTELIFSIFAASFIALAVGILDDKFDTSPYLRFFINIICGIIIVAAGISVPFITNPFGGILYLNQTFIPLSFLGPGLQIPFSDIIAVFWIVWVMNMLNWSKGVDGQMPGIVAISSIVIGILSLRFAQVDETSIISAILSFIIAGSALGFLIFNFYPARIFPGYGATSIYLLLGVVAILSSAKLATAMLVMGIPLADGAYTIFRRIVSGRSPFWHDKKHFHHLLLSHGLSQRSIALFYWSISAILGALSLVLSSRGKLFAIIMVVVLVGGAILFLNFLLKRDRNDKVAI